MGVIGLIKRYVNWLHTRWPAGVVEKLPVVRADGSTNVPGVYVVGDLKGIPLLKFAADTGARAVRTIVADPDFGRRVSAGRDKEAEVLDLVIVGGGVSGMAAALEARKAGLRFEVLEGSEPFSTVVNFPKGKPIYTYPTDMTPAGDLQFAATVKEPLVDELRAQTLGQGVRPRMGRVEEVVRRGGVLGVRIAGAEEVRARRVIIAVGRSGSFRKLGVAGEDSDKVSNRLHDPKDYCEREVLVVGGGDSALEASIALVECGGRVTLCYRKAEFTRPKPANLERLERLVADPSAEVAIEEPTSERVTTAVGGFLGGHRRVGSIRVMMSSRVRRIGPGEVTIVDGAGDEETMANDAVFTMIGRQPPLDFLRRCGVGIRGDWRASRWVGFGLFILFCVFLYHWKSAGGIPVHSWFERNGWFPFNVPGLFDSLGGAVSAAADRPSSFLYTLKTSMAGTSFHYTLAYCLCVVIFGIRRIRRRKTPYITRQTTTLMLIQCVPLFLLPELLLPWAGRNGWFADGTFGWLADQFFERYDELGIERAYWRAYGFILAWPLMVGNIFTDRPLGGWMVVGTLQTFVVIPLLIRRWGKGAYCGWICPCGALAETLGDTHREKMPHGPVWNRLNMVGQLILAAAFLLLLLRVGGWLWPESFFLSAFEGLASGIPLVNYKWLVDVMLAGVVGLGCYFWLSGRVWCRFACPLAALMHIYARFSRFRIFADKKKCISCNVCTSVCHQGIDVMNFANKGLAMEDPQCVRCSACVQSCPTGVLSFGRLAVGGEQIEDRLGASPVRMMEG